MFRTTLFVLVTCIVLPLVSPPGGEVQAGSPGLAGSDWIGTENLQGYGRLRFKFAAGGAATMIDAKDTVPGTWTLSGSAITLTFFKGQVTYSGTVSGRTMSGTARNAKVSWAWNVARNEPSSAQSFGLPKNNQRTSEYGSARVYKTDAAGKILEPQPAGYPRTVPSDYKPAKEEKVKTHQGIDFSSRDEKGNPANLDFRAGVYGRVVEPLGGQYGTVTVQLPDGTRIQYLHTSQRNVRVGDPVTPESVLGRTGNTGANAIHLHVQARDSGGNPINPDEALTAGQVSPAPAKKK